MEYEVKIISKRKHRKNPFIPICFIDQDEYYLIYRYRVLPDEHWNSVQKKVSHSAYLMYQIGSTYTLNRLP